MTYNVEELRKKYGVTPTAASSSGSNYDIDALRTKYGVQPAPTPQPAANSDTSVEENGSVLGTIGKVIGNFPGKQLGQAIGTSIGGIKEAIQTRSMEPIRQAANENDANFSKIVGDVANAVILPASLAINPAGSVVKAAGQLGALSAGAGAATSLSEGNTKTQVLKDAFQSGLTGAVTGGVFAGIGKGISKLGERAPEAIYNNALRIGLKLKQSGKSPAKFLISEKVAGGLGTFKRAAEEGMEQSDAAIKAKIAKTAGGATYGEIRKSAIENLKKELGSNLYTDAAIKEMVDSVPLASLQKKGVLNWDKLDETRSELGKLVGDGRWMSTNPSEKVKATQAVYRSLASLIQKTTKTEAEFARYSQWIRTKKAVDRAIDLADSKYGLGLFDRIGGATGIVGGALSGDDAGEKVKNASIGLVGGVAAQRLFSSPAAQTKVAQFLSRIDEIPTDSAGAISKAALGHLFANIFSENQEQ